MHEMKTTFQDQETKTQELQQQVAELQQQVAELQATRDETKRQVDEEIAELKRETAVQLEKTTNETKSQLTLIQATKQDEKLATKTPPISLRPERDPTTQLVISNVTYKENEDLQSIVRRIASIKQADQNRYSHKIKLQYDIYHMNVTKLATEIQRYIKNINAMTKFINLCGAILAPIHLGSIWQRAVNRQPGSRSDNS